MFCPRCRAEYRQGFTRCADCDVELVTAFVPPEAPPPPGPIEMMVIPGLEGAEVLVVESLLMDAGLPYETLYGDAGVPIAVRVPDETLPTVKRLLRKIRVPGPRGRRTPIPW